MSKLLTLFIAVIAFSVVALDADARRRGGGRSYGMQREMTPRQAPRPPAQQQATPNAPAQQPVRLIRLPDCRLQI